MFINGYMIKEVIRSLERKRDDVSFDFSFQPTLKMNEETGKFFLDDSVKFEQESKIREDLQLIADIDSDIRELRKIQRAYNEYAGIFQLLDEQPATARKVTLLTRAEESGKYGNATKSNINVIEQLNLGFGAKEKGVNIGVQYLDFSADLKALKERQEKIKNKIGTKNAKMIDLSVDKRLFDSIDKEEETIKAEKTLGVVSDDDLQD